MWCRPRVKLLPAGHAQSSETRSHGTRILAAVRIAETLHFLYTLVFVSFAAWNLEVADGGESPINWSIASRVLFPTAQDKQEYASASPQDQHAEDVKGTSFILGLMNLCNVEQMVYEARSISNSVYVLTGVYILTVCLA